MTSLFEEVLTHTWWPKRASDYIRWYPKSLRLPGEPLEFLAKSRPSGLYIHVPFCDAICKFCPFNKRLRDRSLIQQYVDALLAEIEVYGRAIASPGPLEFIYFGGGTPSVLSSQQLEAILNAVGKFFRMSPIAEITLETHPTHLQVDYLGSVKSVGVTRISTGIQSFSDRLLAAMGAQHTTEHIRAGLEAARRQFNGIAIDLLYRCPEQTEHDWAEALTQAASHPAVNHISLYSLVLKNERGQPSEETDLRMCVDGLAYLKTEGFYHYASCASGGLDLARLGQQCVYETRHWAAPQAEFLGLGPGALGFTGGAVTVNGLDIHGYIDRVSRKILPLASSHLADEDEQRRRYFVLGVKTFDIPFGPYRDRFKSDPLTDFKAEFRELARLGLATVTDHSVRLTDVGRLFVDSVSATFFSRAEEPVMHPEEPEIRKAEIAAERSRRTRTLAQPISHG